MTVKNISSMQISTDTPYQAGGTISPDLCVTPELPDIVIHDRLTNELFIFELTHCPTRNLYSKHPNKKSRKIFPLHSRHHKRKCKSYPICDWLTWIHQTTRLAWNFYLSTARRKPHTEPSWKIFLQSPFTPPTTYLYKGNPTNRTTTYRQSSKCSKPPPNVTMTMTIPLTLDHPPILKSTPANHATKPKSCFAYCEAQSDLFIYALSGH